MPPPPVASEGHGDGPRTPPRRAGSGGGLVTRAGAGTDHPGIERRPGAQRRAAVRAVAVEPSDFQEGTAACLPQAAGSRLQLQLLAQDDLGGLEIRNAAGDWIQATPIPGTFIVNVGDMLEGWTNGLFKATQHRVVNTGKERFSLPLFFAVGWVSYRVVMRPVVHASHNVQIFTTVGLSIALQNVALVLWTGDFRFVRTGYYSVVVRLGDTAFNVSQIVAFAVAVTFTAALFAFLFFYMIEQFVVVHPCEGEQCEDSHAPVGVLGMSALLFHSVLDGMLIGIGFQESTHLGVMTTVGILAHQLPVGRTAMSLFFIAGHGRALRLALE